MIQMQEKNGEEEWVSKREYMEGELVKCILGGENWIGIVLKSCMSYGGYVTYIVLNGCEECWLGIDNLKGRRET
jgi:hypothetical protein